MKTMEILLEAGCWKLEGESCECRRQSSFSFFLNILFELNNDFLEVDKDF
jgi:hypothetical protein